MAQMYFEWFLGEIDCTGFKCCFFQIVKCEYNAVKLGFNEQLGTGHFFSLQPGLIFVLKWPIYPKNMFVITDFLLTTEFVITELHCIIFSMASFWCEGFLELMKRANLCFDENDCTLLYETLLKSHIVT
jgi:hypothetical protein